ncbi:uncharacterized protein LOC144870504 [Branchiostoma floridae x Branchiostoma japonicum]
MIEELGALHKMIVINTCRDFSKDTIKERGDIYRSKVWIVAMATTAGTHVPLAGAVAISDALATAYQQYKEGFGLTNDAVEQLAKMTNKSPEDLKKFLSIRLLDKAKLAEYETQSEALRVVQLSCSELGIKTSTAGAIFVDQTIDLIFPIIGALVTVPLAYGITIKILHALISRMERCASELFDYAFKEPSSDV